MPTTFVLAQMSSHGEPAVNLKNAEEAVEKALAAYKPDLMVFPEVFMSHFPIDTDRQTRLSTAQKLEGPFVAGMQTLAKKHGIWMVFGMNEKTDDPNDDRNYNTTVMLNAKGEIVSSYHKTHLYDAFGYKESNDIKPGDDFFEPVDTPFGRIGLFVCYEVRFPEVARYQASKGADIIIMPTAWVRGDLKSHHFRTLVTARAIENTVYMVACDQIGPNHIGESVVVDPMGVPVACAGECVELLPCYIDLDRVKAIRKKLPAFKDRRPELYTI
ncbi:carbon-nitrogen hydrolase family protein [Oscillospiraceae bacterium LTW-04]|nr:carbon-nitrogen hydrolase family protein [Oscillospiraceae bacterium MB24-C1]